VCICRRDLGDVNTHKKLNGLKCIAHHQLICRAVSVCLHEFIEHSRFQGVWMVHPFGDSHCSWFRCQLGLSRDTAKSPRPDSSISPKPLGSGTEGCELDATFTIHS
jgi:hypothetical protein